METLDYITIGSAVLNFLLGGTTVWSIIQWLSEKRLRKIEEQSKETSLETQRFEALTQQEVEDGGADGDVVKRFHYAKKILRLVLSR